jgi:hypothetical protein
MASLSSASSGPWPAEFPTTADGRVDEGLVVRSKSGRIEGRTTGSRRPCSSTACPGWFIGVLWETGQQTYICSEGWRYDSEANQVRVVAGGEISARWISPPPEGVQPLPVGEWPERSALYRRKGWRRQPHLSS